MRRPRAAALAATLTLSVPLARAQDRWTNVRPGVDLLQRSAPGPQAIFAARVDLRVPTVSVRASADNPRERGVSTLTFARNVGATVAINADWSDGRTPVGLAISDGFQWHDHIANNSVGGHWGFFGCTSTRVCSAGVARPLDVDWDLLAPTLQPRRFFQAVGANGIPMVQGGRAATGCYDRVRNPRSAVGISQDRNTLWLVVVDGRRSTAVGMTCDELRALMINLGSHDAVMLDGGGSSTLVVSGTVRNTPSDGSPRTVSNHLAVMVADRVDARCTVPSGRWCAGTQIVTCQGGRYLGSGDCAAFGARCERDGDHAFCVDYRCPGGRGNSTACVDARRLARCNDGQYSVGDCGAFGVACVNDAMGARCGTPPPPDAGAPPRDAGPPVMDAGPPAMDAGPPAMDARPPAMDAGPPAMDAVTDRPSTDRAAVRDVSTTRDATPTPDLQDAPGAVDAGLAVDAPTPSEDDDAGNVGDASTPSPEAAPGCGCRTAVPRRADPTFVTGLLMLATARRRRRAPRRGSP